MDESSLEQMTTTINLDTESIHNLDLSPVRTVIEPWLQAGAIAAYEQQLQFEINYPRAPEDPRELSEIPEVRLWFIRLDASYPWLPFLLNWQSGEFGRYAAMLVPHQFSRQEGIQYNPEALEIFLMQKLFILTNWMKQQQISSRARLKAMAQLLGYDLDDTLFDLLWYWGNRCSRRSSATSLQFLSELRADNNLRDLCWEIPRV